MIFDKSQTILIKKSISHCHPKLHVVSKFVGQQIMALIVNFELLKFLLIPIVL